MLLIGRPRTRLSHVNGVVGFASCVENQASWRDSPVQWQLKYQLERGDHTPARRDVLVRVLSNSSWDILNIQSEGERKLSEGG